MQCSQARGIDYGRRRAPGGGVGILSPKHQRHHRTLHVQNDVQYLARIVPATVGGFLRETRA